MFERMVRPEIDGGVGSGMCTVNACTKVGWFPGYGEVKEVDTVTRFEGRVKLDAAVDCVNVLLYFIWVGARRVVYQENVIHIPSVGG